MNLWKLADNLKKQKRTYPEGDSQDKPVKVCLTFSNTKELESTIDMLKRVDEQLDNRDRMG